MASHRFFSITSLSHSGSTVFSMALACHQNLISLGEVFQVLRYAPEYWLNDTAHACSCGKPASECSFWGPTLKAIQQRVPMPSERCDKYQHVAPAYQVLLEQFHQKYGHDKFMVDTSKGVRHLKLMANHPELNPTVYFLMRDVRSFACSQTRLAKKQKRQGYKRIKGHYWFQMLKWYFGNRKRENLLKQSDMNFTKLGYEHFCFNAADVLKTLYQEAGLPPKQCDKSLQEAEHHILFGNPMRLSAEKSSEINYDSRWLKEEGYLLPACLMPFVMKYNNSNVYQG